MPVNGQFCGSIQSQKKVISNPQNSQAEKSAASSIIQDVKSKVVSK